jgi:hypothetical protein
MKKCIGVLLAILLSCVVADAAESAEVSNGVTIAGIDAEYSVSQTLDYSVTNNTDHMLMFYCTVEGNTPTGWTELDYSISGTKPGKSVRLSKLKPGDTIHQSERLADVNLTPRPDALRIKAELYDITGQHNVGTAMSQSFHVR